MSEHFSEGFDFYTLRREAEEEKARKRNLLFRADVEIFQKNVKDAFVDGRDYSDLLILPHGFSENVKIDILRELDRKFPGRIEVYIEDGERWHWRDARTVSTLDVFSGFRIRCK